MGPPSCTSTFAVRPAFSNADAHDGIGFLKARGSASPIAAPSDRPSDDPAIEGLSAPHSNCANRNAGRSRGFRVSIRSDHASEIACSGAAALAS